MIGPGGKEVVFGGTAQVNHDNADAISSRLPTVLAVMAVISFVLLFLLTGSVVLPLKALVLNVLSLTATFGALVWIFQDGHLGGLGTTPVGTLVAHVPVLLFCVAFGLSMDYEVFLISRIREYWLASGQTPADNDEAVPLGLARTGRVVTAAALLMSISFAALIASNVSIMRMFGLGLTLAVLVDATLVRMLLMPAFMHVLGQRELVGAAMAGPLHARFGLSESTSDEGVRRSEQQAEDTVCQSTHSSRTVISPVVPSTSTMAPGESRRVAPRALTTHGNPNSRATIAACDIGPPRSVTTAEEYANAGV